MKKYIRTKDNKFYDTTKEHYLIDGDRLVLVHEYETHPTMATYNGTVSDVYITEKHVEYRNCGFVDKEADTILEVVKPTDLLAGFFLSDFEDKSFYTVEYLDKELDEYNFPTELISEIYTKQGDDYKLAWDKNRGVI